MTDADFRTKLIKLAFDNPGEVREKLLPMLKESLTVSKGSVMDTLGEAVLAMGAGAAKWLSAFTKQKWTVEKGAKQDRLVMGTYVNWEGTKDYEYRSYYVWVDLHGQVGVKHEGSEVGTPGRFDLSRGAQDLGKNMGPFVGKKIQSVHRG